MPPEYSGLKIGPFGVIFSLSAHENAWILRTSFTAPWKTNNHSSSCTSQMEHHFILPVYYVFETIQLQHV